MISLLLLTSCNPTPSQEVLDGTRGGRVECYFNDPGTLDVWTGMVDFDDGAGPQPLTIDQVNQEFTLNHTYNTNGTYNVTVTIVDDDLGERTDTFEVTMIPAEVEFSANLFHDGDRPSGVTGVHRLGVADRHLDLAIIHRSLQAAFGAEAVFGFYQGYGHTPKLVALDHYLLIDVMITALVPGPGVG